VPGALAIMLWAAVAARAGTIELTIRTDVHKSGRGVEVVLRVSNGGDDVARGVQPRVTVLGSNLTCAAKDIAPGRMAVFTVSGTFDQMGAVKTGTHPVRIDVAYADADGARQHAPSYGILQTSAEAPDALSLDVVFPPVDLGRDGRGAVALRNVGTADLALRACLYTSPGVGIEPAAVTLALGPGQETNVLFALANRGEPPGGRKPLLLFVENETQTSNVVQVWETPLRVLRNNAPGADTPTAPLWCRPAVRQAAFVAGALLALAVVRTWFAVRKKKR
jgi:hypothetical protein